MFQGKIKCFHLSLKFTVYMDKIWSNEVKHGKSFFKKCISMTTINVKCTKSKAKIP